LHILRLQTSELHVPECKSEYDVIHRRPLLQRCIFATAQKDCLSKGIVFIYPLNVFFVDKYVLQML